MTNVTPIDPKRPRRPRPPKNVPPPRPGWEAELTTNREGRPKATLGNVDLVLRNDESYLGRFAFNEMSAAAEMDGKTMTDANFAKLRIAIERRYGMAVTTDTLVSGICAVADEQRFHPVRQYLESLMWDGEPRIDRVVAEVLRAEATSLHVSYVRKWFLGQVARALDPGCKVDTALVLQGPQGAGKSTFFRALTEPYFTDTDIDLSSKDAYLVLGGSWCVEWGELDAMSRASRERVKAFLSSAEDVFRQPYGRGIVKVKRTAVVVGTTNEKDILRDPTGSRRFWVLPCSSVDIETAKAWRAQLWAEAVAGYRAHEPWWLTSEEDVEREQAAEEFREEDPWTEEVLSWAHSKLVGFTMSELLEHGLKKPPKEQEKRDEMRVAAILKAAGFERGKMRRDKGERGRPWSRPAAKLVTEGDGGR